MIADLKPYAEYKESGLPWLDPLAKHAEIKAVILAIEKEAERLHAELIGGEKQ